MPLFKCKACCCETSCMLVIDDEYVDLPNQCPFSVRPEVKADWKLDTGML